MARVQGVWDVVVEVLIFFEISASYRRNFEGPCYEKVAWIKDTADITKSTHDLRDNDNPHADFTDNKLSHSYEPPADTTSPNANPPLGHAHYPC